MCVALCACVRAWCVQGGNSIWGVLNGNGKQRKYFEGEIRKELRHDKAGTVACASSTPDSNTSQFYITLRDGVNYMDKKHTVFGCVSEGLEVLQKINELYCDDAHRPYIDHRLRHTYVLDDPFDALKGMPDEEPDSPVRDIPEVETVKPRIQVLSLPRGSPPWTEGGCRAGCRLRRAGCSHRRR